MPGPAFPIGRRWITKPECAGKKANSGPSFLDFAIGTAGGVAIAAPVGGPRKRSRLERFRRRGNQWPVPSGESGGGYSSTPTSPEGSSTDFDAALRNLENSCGERYRSAFSEQDHGRVFLSGQPLPGIARSRKDKNQQQLDALKHDFEVLRSQGLESRCPYFGVLGGTYNENQTIPGMPEPVTETKPAGPVIKKRTLPTCADGDTVPITVAEGKKPGCPPERWCRWNACQNDECRRRYPKCEPGVLPTSGKRP